MSRSRFKVYGKFNGAKEATVTVDRGAGIFEVRPLRSRVAYVLPLSEVADIVMWRCVKAEAENMRRQKQEEKS